MVVVVDCVVLFGFFSPLIPAISEERVKACLRVCMLLILIYFLYLFLYFPYFNFSFKANFVLES